MQQLITGSLLVVYIQLNMFRASLCPSSGAYQQQQQPLVYRRNVVVAVLLVVVRSDRPRPTTLLPPRCYYKPEAAAAAVDRHLMMDIRMPETCWAVFKRQTMNLQLIAASSWLIQLNVIGLFAQGRKWIHSAEGMFTRDSKLVYGFIWSTLFGRVTLKLLGVIHRCCSCRSQILHLGTLRLSPDHWYEKSQICRLRTTVLRLA
jgi:hypothetical protein